MTTPDTLAIATRGLEPETALAVRTAFEGFLTKAQGWAEQALAIKVTDVSQKREMRLARESRLALREIRINVENARKALKEESLRKGQAIDAVAKTIRSIIEPIEAHLQEQEDFAKRAEERTRAEALARQAEEERRQREARETADREERARLQAENERLRREAAERDTRERAERELVAQRASRSEETSEAAGYRDAPSFPGARPLAGGGSAEPALISGVQAVPDGRWVGVSPDGVPPIQPVLVPEGGLSGHPSRPEDTGEPRAHTDAAVTAGETASILADPISPFGGEGANTNAAKDVAVPGNDAPAAASPAAPAPRVAAVGIVSPRPAADGAALGFLGITASAIERTIQCPSWVAFPHAHSESEYAARGHTKHGYIRNVLAGVAPEVAIRDIDGDERETCRLIDWHKLAGDLEDIESEGAYAINVRTREVRFLGHNIGRRYAEAAAALGQPLTVDDVCGSFDLAGTKRGDGRPVVRDVKSGYQDVTPAKENGQTRFFAAAKHLQTGAPEVDSEIAKLKPDGKVWIDPATFGAWEIDSFLDELEGAVERAKAAKRVYLAGGTPDVSEGPACEYCPAADACPAKTRLARAMLGELGAVEGTVESMTPEAKGRAYVLAHDRIAPLLKRVLESLKEAARREPIPLPSGLELREAPYSKSSLNAEALTELARSLGATDEAIKGCYRESVVRPIKACKPAQTARSA